MSKILNRRKAEKRFGFYCRTATLFVLATIIFLMSYLVLHGLGALRSTEIALSIDSTENIDVNKALHKTFPTMPLQQLQKLISFGAAFEINKKKDKIWILASSDVDIFHKSKGKRNTHRLSLEQKKMYQHLRNTNNIRTVFNWNFFTKNNSQQPELAGLKGALIGSLFIVFLTFLISFPLGVLSAIYMEEFAPKNKFTRLIDVNMNNLAAVPSIIYGLLGLAVFIQFFGLPRSSPLVASLILALMIMPIIYMATRTSLKTVPKTIREAALGLGASQTQVVFHHVLPLSAPGIITGSILGIARALGETAPLLMIGMVAFIIDTPQSLSDPATALPVQIYLWATSPEYGFIEKSSAAIVVLMLLLCLVNGLAFYLRKKFEKRW